MIKNERQYKITRSRAEDVLQQLSTNGRSHVENRCAEIHVPSLSNA